MLKSHKTKINFYEKLLILCGSKLNRINILKLLLKTGKVTMFFIHLTLKSKCLLLVDFFYYLLPKNLLLSLFNTLQTMRRRHAPSRHNQQITGGNVKRRLQAQMSLAVTKKTSSHLRKCKSRKLWKQLA